VNGAVVNVRLKGDKLAVWLADSTDLDSLIRYDFIVCPKKPHGDWNNAVIIMYILASDFFLKKTIITF
jgi:hypothetical protein